MRSARTRSLSIALLIAAIALLVSAASAAAATIPITGGEVDWGIKQSFREYVKSPTKAAGQIEVSGGAQEAADGTYKFPVTTGTYDTTTHVVEVQGTGTVHFTGHFMAGVPALDMTFTNPRVVIGKTGVIYADVTSKSLMTGEMASYPGVEFALVDASSTKPVTEGEAVSLSGMPAELTAEGSQAFAGFYKAGEPLDPLSLVASYAPKVTPEEPKKEAPKTDPAPPPTPAPAPVMPTLKSTGGGSKLGGGGSATIATVACPSTEPCSLAAPKNVKFKLGGKSFTTKVNAPKWILAGKSGKVAVKLPKAALEELGGGTLKISVKLVLGSGTQSTTKVVKATLKADGGGKNQ